MILFIMLRVRDFYHHTTALFAFDFFCRLIVRPALPNTINTTESEVSRSLNPRVGLRSFDVPAAAGTPEFGAQLSNDSIQRIVDLLQPHLQQYLPQQNSVPTSTRTTAPQRMKETLTTSDTLVSGIIAFVSTY
jgi:hypothetical protein